MEGYPGRDGEPGGHTTGALACSCHARRACAAPARAQRGRPMRWRFTAERKQAMTSFSSTCCAAKCSETASSSASRLAALSSGCKQVQGNVGAPSGLWTLRSQAA